MRRRGLGIALIAVAALGAQTAEDLSRLRQKLHSTDPGDRKSAAKALARFGTKAKSAIPDLIQMSENERADLRESAVDALAHIETVPDLINALKVENPEVRASAAHALGHVGTPAKDAVPELIRAFADNDPEVRQIAFDALGRIGTSGVPDLIRASEDADDDIRESAARALARIGRKTIPDLLNALKDPNYSVRAAAAHDLGHVDSKEVIPQLLTTLRSDQDFRVRKAAANALQLIGKDSVSGLINALKDDSVDVRALAAEALGDIGKPRVDVNDSYNVENASAIKNAIPDLIRVLKDPRPYVRMSAAHALDSISEGLSDIRDAGALPLLNDTARALRAADGIDPVHADRVQSRASSLHLWPKRLSQAYTLAKEHPGVAAGILLAALYLIWCVVLRFGVLKLTPLGILRWTESMGTASYALPKWLGEVQVPFRKLLLGGVSPDHPRILDAWVNKHVDTARTAFDRNPTYSARKTYVPLPAVLDSRRIPELKAEDLRSTCDRKRWCLLISGEGGLGKTTLACQMALWAMEDDPVKRLCQDLMLPVLIEPGGFDVLRDVNRFRRLILGQLQLAVGEQRVPSELFEGLLSKRRILVILDSVSEMPRSPDDPEKGGPENPDFPVACVIVTSRNQERVGQNATILPVRVDKQKLAGLIDAYLRQAGITVADSVLFEACSRLARMLGKSEATPLLARLFAEQLVFILGQKLPLEKLPSTVPDLMLNYLNNLNRTPVDGSPDNRSVHQAAKIAAWECVRKTFRSERAAKDDVRRRIGDAGLKEELLDDLERRLHVVRTIAPTETEVQFEIDPLSEYLAALRVLELYRDNSAKWRRFLEEVDRKPGAPESIRGFLGAVHDCCLAKGDQNSCPRFLAEQLAALVHDGTPE